MRMISGSNYEHDPETSRDISEKVPQAVHTLPFMGDPKTWFELAELLDDEITGYACSVRRILLLAG